MSRPTREEIEAEIEALEEIKPKVPESSHFGDDNWASIDAQIEVLRGEIDENDFEIFVDDGDWSEHIRDEAQYAYDWMTGYTTDPPPSEGWQAIAK